MSMLKGVPKPQEHICSGPAITLTQTVTVGSLWMCDECGRVWVLRGKPGYVAEWWHESKRGRRKRWNRGEVYKEELL